MKKYKITCGNCKNSDTILIKDDQIIWGKNEHIISGRKRLDGNWGWQCRCMNSSLLTRQEKDTITDLKSPDPLEIQSVIDNLIVEEDKKFSMQSS